MPRHSVKKLRELRQKNIGRLITEVHREFRRRALARIQDRINPALRSSHITVLIHLPTNGARLTDLAESANVTKQAMGQLVDDVQALGLVSREVDPEDRRAKRIVFTEEGLAFLSDGMDIIREGESEYAAILGRRRLEDLRSMLLELLEATDSLPQH